jgi:gliding motility-associated transport system ATP-binding protein
MPPPAIVADRLTKWYGPRRAAVDVSFAVEPGEVMALLGPNGCGKTTVLRLLTGYLRPSAGTARVGGLDVERQGREVRRHVGYVPEDAPLYDSLQVAEFLRFMARLRGLSGDAVPRAVRRVVARLGLPTVEHTLVARLSRGFRQRVAIAQALLTEPDVLVLDEPTNGLDPQQIIEVRELIQELAGRHTVLVSSHVLTEVEKVADRVVIMLDGCVLAVQALGAATRRLRLRVRGPASAVTACLGGVPGVEGVEITEGREGEPCVCLVDVGHDPAIAERLGAVVVTAGFALAELTAAPVDLEELFLRLTTSQGGGR